MPDARRTRSLACNKKHTSVVATGTPETAGIPCAMVLRFPSCSPRRPGFIVSVAPEKRQLLEDLISASGYQAHTTSPSVPGARRLSHTGTATAFHANVRDDREAPL
jgi:hypothetical protein